MSSPGHPCCRSSRALSLSALPPSLPSLLLPSLPASPEVKQSGSSIAACRLRGQDCCVPIPASPWRLRATCGAAELLPCRGLASLASPLPAGTPMTEQARQRCEHVGALLQEQVFLLETQRGAAGQTAVHLCLCCLGASVSHSVLRTGARTKCRLLLTPSPFPHAVQAPRGCCELKECTVGWSSPRACGDSCLCLAAPRGASGCCPIALCRNLLPR